MFTLPLLQEAAAEMKTFVLDKHDKKLPENAESPSRKRTRRRGIRKNGPEPRRLFQDAEDDEAESPVHENAALSERDPEDEDSAPESPVPDFKEDDDVFSGRYSMPKPNPTPKKTPRRRRASASSKKVLRQRSDASLLGPTPCKEREALDDVDVLSKEIDQRLLDIIPETLNACLV